MTLRLTGLATVTVGGGGAACLLPLSPHAARQRARKTSAMSSKGSYEYVQSCVCLRGIRDIGIDAVTINRGEIVQSAPPARTVPLAAETGFVHAANWLRLIGFFGNPRKPPNQLFPSKPMTKPP